MRNCTNTHWTYLYRYIKNEVRTFKNSSSIWNDVQVMVKVYSIQLQHTVLDYWRWLLQPNHLQLKTYDSIKLWWNPVTSNLINILRDYHYHNIYSPRLYSFESVRVNPAPWSSVIQQESWELLDFRTSRVQFLTSLILPPLVLLLLQYP